jgi:hypothetical protein
VLVIDEVAGKTVVDAALVEEATPGLLESPHDTANSITSRPTINAVLADRTDELIMPGPYAGRKMIDRG